MTKIVRMTVGGHEKCLYVSIIPTGGMKGRVRVRISAGGGEVYEHLFSERVRFDAPKLRRWYVRYCRAAVDGDEYGNDRKWLLCSIADQMAAAWRLGQEKPHLALEIWESLKSAESARDADKAARRAADALREKQRADPWGFMYGRW